MELQQFINECDFHEERGFFYEVTPDVYFSFQRCSGDFNPLHTDLRYARNHGFESCVMYGNILNAFVSHFVGMLLPMRDVIIQSQDLNFHKPVYLNDKLELRCSIETVSEAANSIAFKLKFYKQGESISLVAKGRVAIGLLK